MSTRFPDNDALFDFIKGRANEMGMSIKTLAESAGISKNTIYNLRTRYSAFGISTATRLAEKLGCPVSDLLRIDTASSETVPPPKTDPQLGQFGATSKQPAPKQVEVKIVGSFSLISDAGECRIIAKSIQLSQEETEKVVKKYLFGTDMVSDAQMNKVVAFVHTLKK